MAVEEMERKDSCCVGSTPEQKIEAFDFAINMHERFRIDGTTQDDRYFVISDNKYDKDSEMYHILVPVSEVIEKPLKDVIGVMDGSRNSIELKGYTRIVGYYSATHNWNKSKIGELRDRANGRYGVPGFEGVNQAERVETIETLNQLSGK